MHPSWLHVLVYTCHAACGSLSSCSDFSHCTRSMRKGKKIQVAFSGMRGTPGGSRKFDPPYIELQLSRDRMVRLVNSGSRLSWRKPRGWPMSPPGAWVWNFFFQAYRVCLERPTRAAKSPAGCWLLCKVGQGGGNSSRSFRRKSGNHFRSKIGGREQVTGSSVDDAPLRSPLPDGRGSPRARLA